MSEQLLWVLLSACVLWKTIFRLQHLDVLYLPASLRSLYNYSINTRANFCSVPILQRVLNRAAQQDPWDIIMKKKKRSLWVTATLHIDVFHPEDCEVFWGEYRVIIVAEILLYCRVTPRFLGGSGSWQGSQTADSFTSTFWKGWKSAASKRRCHQLSQRFHSSRGSLWYKSLAFKHFLQDQPLIYVEI